MNGGGCASGYLRGLAGDSGDGLDGVRRGCRGLGREGLSGLQSIHVPTIARASQRKRGRGAGGGVVGGEERQRPERG